MNVTLIYPLLSRRRSQIDENKQFWPPLGLAYIAGVLELKGYKIQILDRDVLLRKNDMDFDKVDAIILGKINGFDSSLIGISATTPNMSDVKHVSRLIKAGTKNTTIVLGGPHPSGEPVLSLDETPAVDIVVRGEGEFAMCDIAAGNAIEGIGGITYRKDGKIISNADREPIRDIDELPMPARHLLDMRFYTRPSRFTSRNLSLRTTSIFTARGCPYRCNFCAGPLVFNGKVRFHSADRVIREIEELIYKYDVEALYFAEDMFLSSRKRAEELLGLFVNKGINKRIKWFAQAKTSIITEDLLKLMKEAGCVGIEYGFESGSQRVLDLMNKRLKIEDNLNAVRLTKRSGLRFQGNIIVGYPGEREDDFRQTIGFIKKVKPNMIGFNIFMPLPGTPSYEKLKAQGSPIPKWDDIGDPEAPQINYADMKEGVFEKLYLEARLKVILPMNLRNFIMDNINNPWRLIKVGLTQFRGVVIKTLGSIYKLASMSANRPGKTSVLFLSYNGLLEPILPSQAVPYLTELSKRSYKFTLLTYEKKKDIIRVGRQGMGAIRDDLESKGIGWHYLKYHKNPPKLSTLFDLIVGAAYSMYLIIRKRVAIVHVRGITPGMIMIFLSKILRVKILFDMRGLLAEEYVGGGLLNEDSAFFKIIKRAERRMLEIADGVAVLTKKHLELNRRLDYLSARNIPMDVIPCCVDMSRFHYDDQDKSDFRLKLGLEGKFVLMYPGKIGTFYLMKEMLDFYKSMLELVPDSIFLIITNDAARGVLKMASVIGLDEGKIRIIRKVRFEDMPRYVRIADAGVFFINPYKKLGSSPIKMGEFLSSGVPVIINPGVGDTEDIVRENRVGVVVREFKSADYVNAAQELLALKKDGEGLKRRCRDAAARHLSLEDAVSKYAGIYEALTGVK